MGLNSLNDYYLMKIYIKEFKLPSISNDIEYKKIVNNKTFLLTHYGKIEVTPNSLKTFILENSHLSEDKNFIKNYTPSRYSLEVTLMSSTSKIKAA